MAEHSRTMAEHSGTMAEHSGTMAEHSGTMVENSRLLEENVLFEEHGNCYICSFQIMNFHNIRFFLISFYNFN